MIYRSLLICFGLAVTAQAAKPTNVVFILSDNQGAWTLGCYGNKDIRTPNIDRLAAAGVRFTRALSSNPVCSPTRATFLTGLMPSQNGVQTFLSSEVEMGPKALNVIKEFGSLPEILQRAGYTCGLSGKWHLGDHLKPAAGFSFWVTKPSGHTTEFYDQQVVENGEVRTQPGYLTDYWTKRGVEFIEQNKDRPFFLFLAYNGPYALGDLLLNKSKNRHAAYYADKEMLSFPRDTMHPWQRPYFKPFHNNLDAMRRVAAEVSGVDDGVGEVLATLERLGLTEDTLVIYASDQGWMGGQNGLWGMGDPGHARPAPSYDPLLRIPLIFRQPGVVPAGKTNDLLVSNYDFLPSMLNYLGLGDKMPATPKSPGRDFSPVLHGREIAWENAVYIEELSFRAIRTDRWKLVIRRPNGPHELYDMPADPGERINLYGQPGMEPVMAEMRTRLEGFFEEYADPQYDLWKKGRSKARPSLNQSSFLEPRLFRPVAAMLSRP